MIARVWLRGLLSHVPGFDEFIDARRGGGSTNSPQYCYSVWLRHLVKAHQSGLKAVPRTVAELGPGDSLGVGLAALLSGAERYWALDVINYGSTARNLEILDELVELFRHRSAIPNDANLCELQPALSSYEFPAQVFNQSRLEKALSPARVEQLRKAIRSLRSQASSSESVLAYMASWDHAANVRPASVDAIFSQAVLEHVEDLAQTYRAMLAWLKPGGLMSHQIDFRSHGTAAAWNGHWSISDLSWKIAKGRRVYFLNREPCSRHLQILADLGFDIVRQDGQFDDTGIGREAVVRRFQHLTDDDLRTCGLFVQALKPTPRPPVAP